MSEARVITVNIDIALVESWLNEKLRNAYDRDRVERLVTEMVSSSCRQAIEQAGLNKAIEQLVKRVPTSDMEQWIRDAIAAKVSGAIDWQRREIAEKTIQSFVREAVRVQYTRAIEEVLGVVKEKVEGERATEGSPKLW